MIHVGHAHRSLLYNRQHAKSQPASHFGRWRRHRVGWCLLRAWRCVQLPQDRKTVIVPVLMCTTVCHSTISPARRRLSLRRHLPTPGLPQKSKYPYVRSVLRAGASRCSTREMAWRRAPCVTSWHSPRATERRDAAARSANAATAAPCISAARRIAMPNMGLGHGRKRTTLPSPHVTEYWHMLRPEKIQKRTTSRAPERPKEPAMHIFGDLFECGGIGASPLWQLVSRVRMGA